MDQKEIRISLLRMVKTTSLIPDANLDKMNRLLDRLEDSGRVTESATGNVIRYCRRQIRIELQARKDK